MSIKIETALDETAAGASVYVYEAPVRIWHWLNALCIAVLAITGYLIASPLTSVSGEASDNFLMGYIRFIHFAAGYVFAVAFMVRIYWALAGNPYARQIFTLPLFNAKWWGDMLHELRWFLFLAKQPRKFVGHNPVAHIIMFFGNTVSGLIMIATGFALYGEGALEGHWSHTLFTGWIVPLLGQSQDVHTWHHLVTWAILCFVILHVYAAIRENIMSRQSTLSTMISGYRTFRE